MNTAEQKFVDFYLKSMDPRDAALKAGYSKTTARSISYTWVTDPDLKPEVYQYVKEQLAARRERYEFSTEQILRRYWQIATADPNEIVEVRRVNCRHCQGEGFNYQWTINEYAQAVKRAEWLKEPLPDCTGGFGFDVTLDPNPLCPECNGVGVVREFLKDSRDFSPRAKALFAGVKATKYGLEVKFNDQTDALNQIAKHLGMFIERKELSGPNGAPLQMPELIRLVAATGPEVAKDE